MDSYDFHLLFILQINKQQNVLQLSVCDTRLRVLYVQIVLYIILPLSICAHYAAFISFLYRMCIICTRITRFYLNFVKWTLQFIILVHFNSYTTMNVGAFNVIQ